MAFLFEPLGITGEDGLFLTNFSSELVKALNGELPPREIDECFALWERYLPAIGKVIASEGTHPLKQSLLIVAEAIHQRAEAIRRLP